MRRLLDAAEFVDTHLNDLQLVRGNRFKKMVKAFAGAERVINPEDEEFAAAREGVRDLRILEFCLDTLCGSVDGEHLRGKLKEVVKDPLDPVHQPKRSTLGRNTQAELFVAAICQKAQLSPRFEEPDLTIRLSDGDLGLAVKRTRSKSGLDKRIAEGIEQIRCSCLPGVVVVDVTLLCNPSNNAFDISLEEIARAWGDHFQDLARKRLPSWKRNINGVELVAIVFQAHILRYTSGTNWGLTSLTFPFNPNKDNAKRKERFHRFTDAFEKGIPPCE